MIILIVLTNSNGSNNYAKPTLMIILIVLTNSSGSNNYAKPFAVYLLTVHIYLAIAYLLEICLPDSLYLSLLLAFHFF